MCVFIDLMGKNAPILEKRKKKREEEVIATVKESVS